MAFAPVAFFSDPLEDYAGFFLKFFEQGTTTPIVMATTAAGTPTVAKAEISSGGTVPIGFIKTAGDVIFIPYVDEAYDAYLFPTEAEADANNTTNAIQVADDVFFLQDFANAVGVSRSFDTVAAMVAATDLSVGNIVETSGYISEGDGGDNRYKVVAASTGTDDAGSFIDLNTLQAKGLFPRAILTFEQFGAAGNGVTDDITAVTNVMAYAGTNQLEIKAGSAKYLMSAGVTTTGKMTLTGMGTSENSGNGSATEFLKAASFNGKLFTIATPAVKFSNFAIEGQVNNGGIGLAVESNATVLEDIAIHNQGGAGLVVGKGDGTGGMNHFRFRNINLHSNGGNGATFDYGAASTEVNAGVVDGMFANNNGGDGVFINGAGGNVFSGITVQANTGNGVHLGVNSSKNVFFGGDFNEANTLQDLLLDAGAEQNAFYWPALTSAKTTDNGLETYIQTTDTNGIKNSYAEFNSVATGTTLLPIDDTIPTSSEGNEFMTITVDRAFEVCQYEITVICNLSSSAINNMTIALFKDVDVPAIAVGTETQTAANDLIQLTLRHKITAPSGTTTFKVRAGGSAAGTTTFNGSASARLFGGVLSSSISINQVE